LGRNPLATSTQQFPFSFKRLPPSTLLHEAQGSREAFTGKAFLIQQTYWQEEARMCKDNSVKARRKVAEETGVQKHGSPHRLENDTEVYGVECLLERRGKNDFFLEWADGSTGWEPRENILDMEMIEMFESTYQGFDKGVDILETEDRGGKLFCRLRWRGRPSQ
jgi:hypothetical protein